MNNRYPDSKWIRLKNLDEVIGYYEGYDSKKECIRIRIGNRTYHLSIPKKLEKNLLNTENGTKIGVLKINEQLIVRIIQPHVRA